MRRKDCLARTSVWGRTVAFGGKKGCRGYNRVFGVQMGCFEVFGRERGVWGCQGYNGVFGAQMGCFEEFGGVRSIMGCWGIIGCLGRQWRASG